VKHIGTSTEALAEHDVNLRDALDSAKPVFGVPPVERSPYNEYENHYANWAAMVETGALPGTVAELEWGSFAPSKVISLSDELCLAGKGEIMKLDAQVLRSAVPIDMPDLTVIELGCGIGRNLHLLAESHPNIRRMIGIDFSPSAIKVAQHYGAQRHTCPDMEFFVRGIAGFRSVLPLSLEPPLFILTRHAIEQCATAKHVAMGIEELRTQGVLAGAALLEPSPAQYDDQTRLGRARMRYNRRFGLNKDLEEVLHEYIGWHVRVHTLGINPLNPTSVFTMGKGSFIV